MGLKNAVVIVTGGSSGIGKAAIDLFLQEGAKVINIDLHDLSRNKAKEANKNVYFFKIDVSDEKKVKEVIQCIFKKFKKIDVLFNNAGFYFEKSTLLSSLAEWEYVVKVNLTSTFLWCKYVIPYMIKSRRGAIINMSSGAALDPEEEMAAYCVAKAGVITLTKSLAREFASYNVRINCVAPGPIVTSMFKRWNTVKEMLRIKKSVPLGRLGKPQDVANAVLFLASEKSSFITGKVLVIDGGIT